MSDAATLAQRQLDAYNAHDLEAFLACYAEDVVVRRLVDGAVLMEGREAMRAGYGPMFAAGQVHAELTGRVVVGRVAVDEERVTGHPSGGIVKALAHYAVRDGLITDVWFVREAD
ncbi:MAG: hypothetical protein ACI8PZ_001295 [Myxococcota bacterium]|jgi:uncharacterized protein (TIGR02246 family)